MTGDYMTFTYLDKSTRKYHIALKAFVDQWLHMSMEDGSFAKIYDTWFD